MSKKSRAVKVQGGGVPCPRCGQTSQLRYHSEIAPKLLKQPFYYQQWFYCQNALCKTNTFMREEDKIYPENQQEDENQQHLFGIMKEDV